jgi:hypothetical protein
MKYRKYLPALLLGGLLSCSVTTDVCSCPPGRTHVVLYGIVTGSQDSLMAGVLVQSLLYGPVCGVGPGEVHPFPDPATTDGTGSYRIPIKSTGAPGEACVEVRALLPGSQSHVDQAARVTLRSEQALVDSARIDLRLP